MSEEYEIMTLLEIQKQYNLPSTPALLDSPGHELGNGMNRSPFFLFFGGLRMRVSMARAAASL